MPARLTSEQFEHRRRTVINAVETGELSLEQACARYAISHRTFYRWKGEDRMGRACTPLLQRLRCVEDVQAGRQSIPQACRQRGISTRTYYRWLAQKDRIQQLLNNVADSHQGNTLPNDTCPQLQQPRDHPSQHQHVVQQTHIDTPLTNSRPQLPPAEPTTTTNPALPSNTPPSSQVQDNRPSEPQPTTSLPQQVQRVRPCLDSEPLPVNHQIQPLHRTAVPPGPSSEHPAPSVPSAAHQPPSLKHDRHQSQERSASEIHIPAGASPLPATSTPLQAVGSTADRPSAPLLSSTNEDPEAPPPTSSEGVTLPPRARRYLRRRQNYPDSPSPSEHSGADAPAQDPPDKHRIVVRHGHVQASFAWYAHATAADIKAVIARRFGLAEDTFFTFRDSASHEVAVSEGLPSGTYDLLLV